MKRGTTFPQVRSRWSIGAIGYDAYSPPCWVKSEFSFTFLTIPGDPASVIFLGPVAQANQWSYQQSNAAIVWHQDWVSTSGSSFGSMVWKQIPTNVFHGCIARVICTFVYIGPFPYATVFVIDDIFGVGEWSPVSGDFGFRFGNSGAHDTRLAYDFSPLHAVSYKQLRDSSIDDHDTAPATWDY